MAMFVGAALSLGPASLAASQNVSRQIQAQEAAESGVQYALSQFRKDPSWKGDLNATTVNDPDLIVTEDNGNVVGFVRNGSNQWARFDFRFNYQDGAAGPDGLDNPATLSLSSPYVSVNNLQAGGQADVPRADGPGFSVTGASARPYTVPQGAVFLAVQGRSGNVDPANPTLTAGSTVSAVEAIFQVGDLGAGVDSAAAMSAQNLTSNLSNNGNKMTVEGKAGRVPRLRSRGSILVNGGSAAENYFSDNGFVNTGSGFTANYDNNKTTAQGEDSSKPFYQLEWDKVRKADAAGPKMAAGTYVWWQDGTLHYYDMNYTTYVNHIKANPTDPGVAAVLPGNVVTDTAGKKVLRLTSSVSVEATANSQDFSLLTRNGAAEDPPTPGDDPVVVVNSVASYAQSHCPAFMSSFNPQAGSLVVTDLANNPVFSASWSYSGAPSPATYSSSVSGPQGGDLFMIHRFLVDPTLYPNYKVASSSGWAPAGVAEAANWAQAQGVSVNDPALPAKGEINPTGVTDNLSAADLEVEFAGGTDPVVLSSQGDIYLTGAIKGTGGSIVSEGNIKVVGLSADFSANEVNGVNLYSKGDITFSSLDGKGSVYKYQDVNLKGVVYSWGNFNAKVGNQQINSWGKFDLEGMLVAYGGDPHGLPGTNGKGNINISADEIKMVFDPSFVTALGTTLPDGFHFKTLSWTSQLQ